MKNANLKTAAIIGGVALAVGGAGYLIVRRIVRTAKINNTTRKLDEIDSKDPREALAVGFAQQLYAGFNPYSLDNTWFSWVPDGTDEEALYRVAREMKARNVEFSRVAKAYRNLYQSELIQDLTSELDPGELRMFYQQLGMNISGIGSAQVNNSLILI